MKRLKELFVFVWALNISVASAQTFQKMTIEEMFEMADANSRSIRTFRLAEEEAGQAVKVAKMRNFLRLMYPFRQAIWAMPGWQTVILQTVRMLLCRTSAITLQ